MRKFIAVLTLSLVVVAMISSCSEKKKNAENDETNDTTLTVEKVTQQIRNNAEKDINDATLFDKRSELYFLQGDIENAINDLEIAINIDSLESEYYLKLSEFYLRNQGKSGKAKEILERCLRIFPNNIDALLNLANIHMYVRQYKKAEEYLEKVMELDLHNPHIYFTKAVMQLEQGDTLGAVGNFQTTVEKEPKYYKAHIELGRLFSLRKDPIALDYYRNAIDLVPESVEAHYSMAMFYQNTKQYQEAIDKYNYILTEIDSIFPAGYHNIGYVNYEMEKYLMAVEYFTKALAIDTAYIEAYLHRGVCYEEMQDFGKARKDYKKCLELVDNYPFAINGLNRLDKKTGSN